MITHYEKRPHLIRAALTGAALFLGSAGFLSAGTGTVFFNDRFQVVTTYGGDFKLRIDTFVNPKCYMSLSPVEQDKLITWINELNLDVIRVPIYAQAMPSATGYDGSFYTNVKTLMNRFPNQQFFASPAETGTEGGWPDWLDGITGSQDGALINPPGYNSWITKSLTTLQQAKPITYLGCFNEDGDIPPSIKWRVYYNFPGKQRVGPDAWSLLNSSSDSGTVVNNGHNLAHYIDIAGSHAYNHESNYFENFSSEWSAIGAYYPGKPFWATESTAFSRNVAEGSAYLMNAFKGGVTGVIQYQVLGQTVKFDTPSTLKARDGSYYAFKGIINQTRNFTRVGSTLSNMVNTRAAAFDKGNGKVAFLLANTEAVAHTYKVSGKTITAVSRYVYSDTTSADPTATTITNIASGGASFTDTIAASLVIYEITVQ